MSECEKCEDSEQVFNEGFIPCPKCNPYSFEYQNKQLKEINEDLVKALEGMKWLYDQRALGPLGAAAKYGPDYEPPTDEQCLEIRAMTEAALAKAKP